jgi:hypothetical protein
MRRSWRGWTKSTQTPLKESVIPLYFNLSSSSANKKSRARVPVCIGQATTEPTAKSPCIEAEAATKTARRSGLREP